MAWSWSHTDEAYSNARANLSRLDRETLCVIFAEWRAHTEDEDGTVDRFNEEAYQTALALAETLPTDTLVDDIWERMEEQATCDNGGFNAWCYPYGCGCHTVSFSTEAEETARQIEKRCEHIRTWTDGAFRLELYDTHKTSQGKSRLAYTFYHADALVFTGEDFCCSPLDSIDGDECVASLLTFLALRPGDTDREYFADYTDEQMTFALHHGEELSLLAMEMEEKARE